MQRRSLMAGAGALLVLAACDRAAERPPASFKSTDITGIDYAKELSLPDVDGRVRTLVDWKGKVVVLFFGYTQCPDVCPTTLAELAALRQQMGAEGERVQIVFVTLDPERDTPEVLKAYVANFGADVVALRGTPEQTKEATREFKIYYAKVPGKTEGSYTLDHSAASFVFDPLGRVRLLVRYGTPADALMADLKTLLAQSSA